MKNTWIMVIALCMLMGIGGCSDSSYRYHLKGNISEIKYGRAYLRTADRETIIDSVDIEGGKFEFSGKLAEPGVFVLQVNRRSFLFFMDGKEMEITCPYSNLRSEYLTGSPANDLEQLYQEQVGSGILAKQSALLDQYKVALDANDQNSSDEIMTRTLQLEDERYALTKEFVQEHADNIFSDHIANVVKGESYEKGNELYDLLSDKVKASSFGKQLRQNVDALAVSAIGVPCPDFQVKDEAGKTVYLSSLKGRIVVLDFWASWCGPCRQEMKNLRLQYAEFKDRGLEMMSISLDDSEEKWRKACEEEQIPWISTRDENGWAKSEIRKLFGIQSIPFIVLVDKEGNIVAKNIRRNLLREKIIELLAEKK